MNPNLLSLVAQAWDDYMRYAERPDLRYWDNSPRLTYRERLDHIRYSWNGDPIPRIEIVKQNLRRLKVGNTMVWRGLNVQDRRQQGDRRRARTP